MTPINVFYCEVTVPQFSKALVLFNAFKFIKSYPKYILNLCEFRNCPMI